MVRDEGLGEITLRKYERPYSMGKRDLMKKICLSLGLLQPGDSRDVIVDILLVLNESQKNKEELDSINIGERVKEKREKNNVELKGVAESNIRRQLKRLRDLMIVEKKANKYKLSEFENLGQIFEDKIKKFIIAPSIERIEEYFKEFYKN